MANKYLILLVEDESNIASFITTVLRANQYEVKRAATGEEALMMASSYCPDLIILDLGLPDIDGQKVLSTVRSWTQTPVIVVSARSHERDKVESLDLGADDYITKPFSISELIARVDAVCRRVNRSGSKPEEASQIVSGPFTLNLKSRTVFKNGEQIDLTQVEYQIMEYFFKNQNTALDRSSILNHIWGESYYGDDKIVDVNIRRIRMKIEDEPSNPQYIMTIWGYGYKWNEK